MKRFYLYHTKLIIKQITIINNNKIVFHLQFYHNFINSYKIKNYLCLSLI